MGVSKPEAPHKGSAGLRSFCQGQRCLATSSSLNDNINMRISRAGCKAQYQSDTTKNVLQDPFLNVSYNQY